MKTNTFFKKIPPLLVFLLIPFYVASAQSLRVGVLAALPAGDAADASSFNLGADASLYFIEVNESLSLGISTGYARFFGKTDNVNGVEIDYDDFSYIPLSASGRGLFGNNIVYIADIGYGFGLNDIDGGLLYQAKLGWTNTILDAFLFYRGITADQFDVNVLGLGLSMKVF